MNVLVLYNATENDDRVDQQDVLSQRDAVVDALESWGYASSTFGCTLNLDAVHDRLRGEAPDVVFNLVESLADTDRLMPLVPFLLDTLHIPYTGASAAAMLATSDKIVAKERLRRSGLPTPDWVHAGGRSSPRHALWIIKPIWEHASVGMYDDAVVQTAVEADLLQQIVDQQRRHGRPLFAEQFIEGREFNISLLAGEVLPPAEIDFRAFPAGKPRIVGQRAKWDIGSFEYEQTPRRFDFPAADNRLLQILAELSRRCWELFELDGFARVDFRVDEAGSPWILEVNVNPCLSPDAGFAAALSEAGIGYDEAVRRILSRASKRTRETISVA